MAVNFSKVNPDELTPILKISFIELFDFAKTKKNIDSFMDQIEEWKYTFLHLSPPSITQNYEIRYEKFTQNITDKVGKYVQRKVDLEKEVDYYYQLLSQALHRLNLKELDYFNMSYYNRLSDELIADRLNIGETMMAHVKRSCIIKIALGLDKAERVTKR